MHSETFEAVEDRTGTKFNIQFIAEHPLKMGTGAPKADVILEAIERVLSGKGMTPIAAQCARMDEAWGTFESQGWLKRMPEALLIAVAKYLQGEIEQRTDPEGDVWDPKLVSQVADGGADLVYLVEKLIEERREVNKT